MEDENPVVLMYGTPEAAAAAAKEGGLMLRVHSSCFTGEVLHSHRCDCREQLHAAMSMVAEEGCGAVIYLHQEGA